MPHSLIKTAMLSSIIGFVVSACGGGDKLVLEQRTLNIGGDQVSLCIDPRLTSKETGLIDFEQAPSADVAGFETLVGQEARLFVPELPPVQYNRPWEHAGKRCNPDRPKNAKIYAMGAGKFPHAGTYKVYTVDNKIAHIEGFYFNREDQPAHKDWKDQQGGKGE